jgi:hypothetical protein
LKSIECLLQIDEVVEDIENPHWLQTNLMSDVCDGDMFRSHSLFSSDPQSLQIILYYEDLEIFSALGANVKKHKVGAFYFSLGNLQPRNHSLLHIVQLVAFAKTPVIQSYGINEV